MKPWKILFVAVFVFGVPRAGHAVESPIKLFSFQVNGLGVYQTGRHQYSGQLAWIPSISAGGVGLRGEVGLTLLKNVAEENYLATNYEAFLTLPVIPTVLTLEGGGGLSTWLAGNGGTHPIASVYVVVGIPGAISRIYAAASRYFLEGNEANQLKLGLGFSL